MSAYAKAIVGAIVAALSSLSVVLVGDMGFGDLTDGQWVGIVIAFLAGLGIVYAVPNKPPA
jgi:hypothetical protein